MKVACGKGYEILLVRKSAVDVRKSAVDVRKSAVDVRKSAVDVRKSAAKSVDRRKKVW